MQELVRTTIGEIFRSTVAACPNAPAVSEGGESITYQQLYSRVCAISRRLLAMGYGHGSHIAIFAENGGAMLSLLLAIWSIGAVAVPICSCYTEKELIGCLNVVGAELLVTDRPVLPMAGLAILKMDGRWFELSEDILPQSKVEEAMKKVKPEDEDTILFTSGSMDSAKPVITTHYSRVNTLIAQAAGIGITSRDRVCSVLPMHHCFSITATLLPAIYAGAQICFPRDRHTLSIIETIEKYQCTVLNAVPTLFSALLRRIRETGCRLSSLRIGLIGGSAYPSSIVEDIERATGMLLLPSLGQTEATAGITIGNICDPIDVRSNTVGRFFPNIEGSIREGGKEMPYGKAGEICVRGYCVMKGYYGSPEETAAAIDRDGWLRTGDIGWLDGEDRLHYVGRKKEMIIRGGENISPAEIENALKNIPGVTDACVVGVPDKHFTEEICALIAQNADVNEDYLRAALKDSLAYYKIPRYFLFVDVLPVMSNGKADRRQISKMAMQYIETVNDEV